MNAFIRVTLSQLITVAGALNKRYRSQVSVTGYLAIMTAVLSGHPNDAL